MDKIFAVWKPKGPTSHDIVDMVRKATGERCVGHAGTLDPLAEGVLVIAVGRGTKSLNSVVAKDKEYTAVARLGASSTTDDASGEIKDLSRPSCPTKAEVLEALGKFKGETDQVPPAYSAIKIGGSRAYKLARQGREPDLKPRRVSIKELELLSYDWPYLRFRTVTGPGVYIRALTRDIGRDLGTGAYIEELVRTRVGDFKKDDCLSTYQLAKLKEAVKN